MSLCVPAPGKGTTQAQAGCAGSGFTHSLALPKVITGHCHMDVCWWIRAEETEVRGEGGNAIPDKRLRVKMSRMGSQLPGRRS